MRPRRNSKNPEKVLDLERSVARRKPFKVAEPQKIEWPTRCGLRKIGGEEEAFGTPGLAPYAHSITPILAVNTDRRLPTHGHRQGRRYRPGPALQDWPACPEPSPLESFEPRLGGEDPGALCGAREPTTGKRGLFGAASVNIRPSKGQTPDECHRAVDPRIDRPLSVGACHCLR
jgi:hypothetical protein